MTHATILALAMALDALLGDPPWLWRKLPHPAVLIGRAVAFCDQRLNRGAGRRLKGIAAMAALALGAGLAGAALAWLGWLAELAVVSVLLAHGSLIAHVRAVADALRRSPGDARQAVAQIVGRDTTAMTRPEIARAAIESAAENFSDGVLAPALWYLLGGLPGLMLYKITNTADSMIGYRTERHRAFGWAAARLDDLLNLVPARLTAALIAALTGRLGAWRQIATDARRHRSPNAGWPEAAMARALGIALSGPRSYHGVRRAYPFVNETGRIAIGAAEIDAAIATLWRVWTMMLVPLAAAALLAG